MPALHQRLRERKIAQWAVVYLAGAWLFLEALGFVADTFAWPAFVARSAVVLAAVGFLAALVLAWYHGEKGRQTASGVELLILAGILVIAGAAVALLGRGPQQRSAGEYEALPGALDEMSIAVLPFANRSELQADEYFTDGMHDEILTLLTKISSLSVRGRTSVMQYRDTEKNLRQIGEELNARYILEGGVQRAGGTVRINLQLANAERDEHVWAETYDRPLTVENLLAVQSEVAFRVAEALSTELTADEAALITASPTDNLEAYDFFLRGKEYWLRAGFREGMVRSAQRMFEQAVELDPGFALAHAWLSIVHSHTYFLKFDFTEERLQVARTAVDRAVELNPDMPEGHLAFGYYFYWGHRAYDRALEELALAERGLPGDAEVIHAQGLLQRRKGEWDTAIVSFKRAASLDPRNAMHFLQMGRVHGLIRLWDEAERYYDMALAVDPEFEIAALRKAENSLQRDGDLILLREYVADYPDDWLQTMRLKFLSRDYPAALAVIAGIEEEIIDIQSEYSPKSLHVGLIHVAAGQIELARAAFESARGILEAAVSEQPDDWRRHASLGLAYAGLDNKEAAIREGQFRVQSHPLAEDPYSNWRGLVVLAQIYMLLDEDDLAIDQLDLILSIPARISVPLLRVDPTWDPLRDHPRFQELLAKYEQYCPNSVGLIVRVEDLG